MKNTQFVHRHPVMRAAASIISTIIICWLLASQTQAFAGTDPEVLQVGFNTKGSLSVPEQTAYLRNEWNRLKANGVDTSDIWLRLQGGTISQKTYPYHWTDEMIDLWAAVQRDFGGHFIFVVNFNDTAENQLAFMNRMESRGLRFDAIELGNEQYLARYTDPQRGDFEEVTERTAGMTVEKYISLSNEYITLLESKNLPFYIQFAPLREEAQKLSAWNDDMVSAVNNRRFASDSIGGTIHLYEKNGSGSLDVSQITNLRSKITPAIPIVITEYGASNENTAISETDYIRQDLDLTARLLSELRPGDLLLNQLLYTDYKEPGAAVLHRAYKGLTPKGSEIMKSFMPYWN